MRIYRTRKQTRTRDSGSFWLSFSDLMSSLLLIIILILFYVMYQYFEMYEINMAEIARQQFDLDQANASLEEERTKLAATETALITQQILLNAAQSDLADAEAVLAQQQADLATAQSDLETAQTDLATAQSDLATAQADLAAKETEIATQATQIATQQQQIEALVGVKTRIITSLSDAMRANSISVTVDPVNGAITLESDVLFAYGSATLTDAGRRNIDAFLPVYLSVLLSDEYRPYVSEIIIEGHTDSTGDYITNLRLSQQRAGSVAEYVLSDGYTVITPQQRHELRQLATANGRSFSDPVVDAYGREDQDKSRRVVFKFRLTDEQMIDQLKTILEEDFTDDGNVPPAENP